jgi:hypothetical protein
MSTTKKEPKPKKEKKASRTKVEATTANVIRAIDECRVVDIGLPAVRKAFGCSWNEAIAIRHAAIKKLKESK